jgi:hypothetical protein
MHLFAVLTRILQECIDGAFIPAKGVHDGLRRTAIRQQSADADHPFQRLVASVKRRAFAGGEGLTTLRTAIALLAELCSAFDCEGEYCLARPALLQDSPSWGKMSFAGPSGAAPLCDWQITWSILMDSFLFKYDPLHTLMGCYLLLI